MNLRIGAGTRIRTAFRSRVVCADRTFIFLLCEPQTPETQKRVVYSGFTSMALAKLFSAAVKSL